jgi:hypothetical protein
VRFFRGERWVVLAGGLPCGGCREGSVLLRSGLSKTWDGQEEP